MTTVAYGQDGRRLWLRVAGHAGYAAPGTSDIVCAGISALCCAVMGWAQEEAEAGRLKVLRMEQGDGHMWLEVVSEVRFLCYAEGAFEVAAKGLGMLAKGYPGCVGVEG